MSTNELRYFYILEWSDAITDIREQFPLELEDTLRIADELGIKHPVDNVSKFHKVFTTDFMITFSYPLFKVEIGVALKLFRGCFVARISFYFILFTCVYIWVVINEL